MAGPSVPRNDWLLAGDIGSQAGWCRSNLQSSRAFGVLGRFSTKKCSVEQSEQKCRNTYGGIHGICVLLNERFDLKYCTKFDNTVSECILWLRLKIQSFEFILGAVYIP